MRNTKQRVVVLNAVNSNSRHLNAELIYEQCLKKIPNISLGTVYRNLNYLVNSNQIKKITMPDGVDRYDKNDIHSHVICMRCGRIDDYFYDFDIKLPQFENYDIFDYNLCFNGICKKCQKEEKEHGIKR